MTLQVTLDEVPVSASNILVGANKSVQSLPAAADGSGSVGGIVFDDPDGTLDIVGWQVVQVTEDDCVSAPTLFYGFVGERTEQRGDYRDGAARIIDTSILDANTMLMARIVTGGSANRQSESVSDRMDWLLASDAVSDPHGGPPMFSDLGFVNASTTKMLDAANYRGMYPAEVLNSMLSEREEIFFLYWDQTAEAVGLFFDRPTATTFTCSLTVSNVLSDTGELDDPGTTCFAPHPDGQLTWNPEDVYTTGSMVYTGGTEYAIYAPTYAFFDAPSTILTRSFRVENDKVGKATTAQILLQRMLVADSTERETLRFTVRLPSTKVGLIQAGMRIACRFSHLTGFKDPGGTYTRIEQIVIAPVDDDQFHYDVTCSCSLHGISTAGSGGGSTGGFPFVPAPPSAAIVQQASGNTDITLPAPVIAGDTLVLSLSARGGFGGTPTGYTTAVIETMPVSAYQSAIYYKTADGTEGDTVHLGTSNVSGTWYELPGTWTLGTTNTGTGDDATAGAPATTGSISAPANSIVFTGSAYAQGGAIDSFGGDLSTTPGAGWTEDYDARVPGGTPVAWTAHQIRTTAATVSGSSTNAQGAPDQAGPNTTNWCAVIASFVTSSSPIDPPLAGKPWGPISPVEVPNAVITSFSVPTGYTWAEGSLRVFVNKLDQTAAVTAEDGAAGTFTLGFAPWTGDLVEVYGVEI